MKIVSYQHIDLTDFEEEYGISGLHDAITNLYFNHEFSVYDVIVTPNSSSWNATPDNLKKAYQILMEKHSFTPGQTFYCDIVDVTENS